MGMSQMVLQLKKVLADVGISAGSTQDDVLSGCDDQYRCIDGVLHERIGSTDAWIIKGNECKEIKS